ncbi:hypothetical protein DB895_09910 [Flavobacterium psychrotolerans]|uniref:Uncharacterized protein n=1 Tax=Flavobacterium psychrotolerans TaxID=2169410 RepID=A0A2U1JII6_9FLAO|nr:hypothetical protein DB895_09910 [Flavobacterium psychrotolerans]
MVTLDPFGYSEKDTTAVPEKFTSKAGNRIHFKSKELTIRNLLLFRKNKPLDSLLFKESERLLRNQSYIRGIQTTLKLSAPKSDSVDVNIRILDSWSIYPKIEASNTKFNLGLDERNFMGTGQRLENSYNKRFSDGKNAFSARYTIPNILNSYIKTTINYHIDLENNYSKSFNIERPFFSPFAKWSAGIYLDQQFKSDSLPDLNNIYAKQNLKYNTHDFWAGNAIRILKGNSENERTTNLITTARFLNINYIESPNLAYDNIDFFSNENFYLIGIGISSRQYIEDRFIFNYQVIEDVPVGKVYGITAGYQTKNNNSRLYLGTRISSGKYYTWGYLSSNFEYGTFLNHSKPEQSTVTFQMNYFTNLFEIGKWKFRQFIKPQIIIGNNRLQSNADKLTLNEGIGLSGLSSYTQFGTKKIFLSFQTQSYSTQSIWGFRFNPYFNCSFGMLGDGYSGFKKSQVNSQFAIGIIIKNDYLVFKSFQISLAYYPIAPENRNNIFKTNTINSEDFGFQDFEINKPETVNYK